MKMAAYAAALAVAFLTAFSGVASAQIPVTDQASILDRGLKHVESIAKSVEQIDKLKSQLEQMQKQYTSMTDARGLGEYLNNPALRDYLPKDWQGVYDKVRKGLRGNLCNITR